MIKKRNAHSSKMALLMFLVKFNYTLYISLKKVMMVIFNSQKSDQNEELFLSLHITVAHFHHNIVVEFEIVIYYLTIKTEEVCWFSCLASLNSKAFCDLTGHLNPFDIGECC